MSDQTILALAGMAIIGALEAFSLYQGIDGQVLSLVIAAIAGLGGYSLGKRGETKAQDSEG